MNKLAITMIVNPTRNLVIFSSSYTYLALNTSATHSVWPSIYMAEANYILAASFVLPLYPSRHT